MNDGAHIFFKKLLSDIDTEIASRVEECGSGMFRQIEGYREAVGNISGLRWVRALAVDAYEKATGTKLENGNGRV